jgi:hypothetical protein
MARKGTNGNGNDGGHGTFFIDQSLCIMPSSQRTLSAGHRKARCATLSYITTVCLLHYCTRLSRIPLQYHTQ